MIRNIIFDWSGTLVDDLPAVWEATNFVLTSAGRDPMTLDQFRSEFALPFTGFYDKHVGHVPMQQLEKWFHGRFRQVQDSVVELPHAREFLEFCRRHKLRTFLLSTVQEEHFAVQSAATGLGNFIDRPYLGIWDKAEKIHEILKENCLVADETMFVGDMQHDIETARHGGIHSCAVLTGYNRLEQLRASNPDVIVEHLGELLEILNRTGLSLPIRDPAHRIDGEEGTPIVTVGGLIFDPDEKVLMLRTHKWSDLWGIPGGKIKRGEACEDALRRELKEETNLDIKDIQFAIVQDCIGSTEFYRPEHFVLLNYVCRFSGAADVRLNEEAREYKWLGMDEALSLSLNTPTRILLEWARKNHLPEIET